MSQLSVKVVNKTQEAEDIVSLELASTDGKTLPSFSAGAHIDVNVPGGLTRQYSLLNDSGEQHRYVIGVLRDPESRGGSTAIHDKVNVGDVLQISEPFSAREIPAFRLVCGRYRRDTHFVYGKAAQCCQRRLSNALLRPHARAYGVQGRYRVVCICRSGAISLR